jgi:hypothetical protein
VVDLTFFFNTPTKMPIGNLNYKNKCQAFGGPDVWTSVTQLALNLL